MEADMQFQRIRDREGATHQAVKVENLVTIINHLATVLAQPPDPSTHGRCEVTEEARDEEKELSNVEAEEYVPP